MLQFLFSSLLFRHAYGALSYTKSPNDKLVPDQLWFKIPNQDAEKEFIEAALHLWNVSAYTFAKIQSAVRDMLTNVNVDSLCQVIREISLENRGSRDAIQGEESFHQSELRPDRKLTNF